MTMILNGVIQCDLQTAFGFDHHPYGVIIFIVAPNSKKNAAFICKLKLLLVLVNRRRSSILPRNRFVCNVASLS